MQNQIDIRPLIKDLLDLNDNFTQEDLTKIKRFSLAFLNNKDVVRRALRNRIKTWNELLDHYYEESKNSSDLLKHLKEVAKSIVTGQKTNILRNLLIREGYSEDSSFTKAVKRTEKMLTRILNGRCFMEFSGLSFDIKTMTPPEIASISKELVASMPASEPIRISLNHILPIGERYDVSKELLLSRVEGMSPEKDDSWLKKLVPTLDALDDQNQFDLVITKLSYHQIIVLIKQYAIANKGTMLLKILKASKDDMVLEVLKSLSKDEIDLFNEAIDAVKDKDLINNTFGYIREIFVAKANAPTPEMNTLAKTLRALTEAKKITSFHLTSIASFRKPIEDLLATNAIFHKLVEKRGHILDSATFHMPEKILMTCEDRLARVTNSAACRKERDNLYTILAELAYGDSEENDDLAAALGNFGVREVDDFIKLGVNVTPLPPKNINDPNASNLLQDEVTRRYCQIFKHFELLGIKTVGDLIDKNIYNYEQLKSFVGKHANNPVSIPSSALKS